jgi:alkanesulfonate monooxygenase SsuD/methylene tetrahydromethanopterin reductase-like flavin-dependent oxidoreductase (luciferase family)
MAYSLLGRQQTSDRRRDRVEYVANFLTADQPVVEWARRREDEGWQVLGCADHFFSPHRAYPHLWVTLATFAAATSRVRLMPSFANNLFRSPVEFAQAALQMQAVSGGRFEAGLGAGWDRDEAVAAGIEYPPAGQRAARYAEAVQIIRRLLTDGSCALDGQHYQVDVPVIGPRAGPPPPLVASLGGPRTIREIAPLVDRVELQVISGATRGGVLDLPMVAAIPRAHVDDLVAMVRAVNATVPLGVFVLCSAGTDERTRSWQEGLEGTFMGGFFGAPAKVADSLHALADAGISRVQVSPFTDAAFELLAPHLLDR